MLEIKTMEDAIYEVQRFEQDLRSSGIYDRMPARFEATEPPSFVEFDSAGGFKLIEHSYY